MRPSDWVQAALFAVVIIVPVVLLPIALAIGSETYVNESSIGEKERQTRYAVTATLTQDAPPLGRGSRGEVVTGTSEVPARWSQSDGTERTGEVKTYNGLTNGAQVRIWLDQNGNVTAEPVTGEQATFTGIGIAAAIWVGATTALCALYLLVRFGLNRNRFAAWDREWVRVDRDWNHPAGSGT